MNWEVCVSTSVRWFIAVGFFVAMLLHMVEERMNEQQYYYSNELTTEQNEESWQYTV